MIFSLLGCNRFDPCQQAEAYRKTSPDGAVDVVVVRKDCGATTSVSNMIYIVKKGDSVRKQELVFLADKVQDLEVTWTKPKQLLINYSEARIFNYTNFWNSRDVENFMYTVEIQEIQKSRTPR
jgi:hypothetical protein